MDLQGPDFSDSRDPIFSDFRDPMIIFSDSKGPNRVPKTPKKTCFKCTNKTRFQCLAENVVYSPKGKS